MDSYYENEITSAMNGIISEDDVIVNEKNVIKSLHEYNIDKKKKVLAMGIKKWLTRSKINPDSVQTKQELYQLYGKLKNYNSFEQIHNET